MILSIRTSFSCNKALKRGIMFPFLFMDGHYIWYCDWKNWLNNGLIVNALVHLAHWKKKNTCILIKNAYYIRIFFVKKNMCYRCDAAHGDKVAIFLWNFQIFFQFYNCWFVICRSPSNYSKYFYPPPISPVSITILLHHT